MKALWGSCVLATALLLPGCDGAWSGTPNERAASRDRGRLSPFRIGPASAWATPGVSDAFLQSHRVYLVTNNGMIVALDAQSTEAGAMVRWDALSGLFRCPVTGAMWSMDGLAWADSPASRAMERCRLISLGPAEDPEVELVVDPQFRFRFEDNQWSRVMSNHLLPEVLAAGP